MEAFGAADRLAVFADPAPAPRYSGRVSGNMRRPRRFHCGLLRAFYLSSMASLRSRPESRAYYERKRSEGKGHKQAVLSLVRRRANVRRAMIRGACYQAAPPVTQGHEVKCARRTATRLAAWDLGLRWERSTPRRVCSARIRGVGVSPL